MLVPAYAADLVCAGGSGASRRIVRLGLAPGIRCLEIGGGRGSIALWLCCDVAPQGQVTATDLDPGFLSELQAPDLAVLRHDVRTDDFPEGSFDLVHVRAVLMHIADRMAVLRRMVSWLAPGGWLVAEESDFGMWLDDFDPLWAAHPRAWHEAFLTGHGPGQGPAPPDPPAGPDRHRRRRRARYRAGGYGHGRVPPP